MRRIVLYCLLFFFVTAGIAWAASKVYVATETVITWGDTGRTHALTFSGITSGTLRMGARHDKGSGSRAIDFTYLCQLSLTGTNVPNTTTVEFWVAWSDGTMIDGGISTSDASAASADKRNNLHLAGLLVVDQATTNTVMMASGRFQVPTQYFSFGFYNGSGLPMQSVTTNYCSVYPTPPELNP